MRDFWRLRRIKSMLFHFLFTKSKMISFHGKTHYLPSFLDFLRILHPVLSHSFVILLPFLTCFYFIRKLLLFSHLFPNWCCYFGYLLTLRNIILFNKLFGLWSVECEKTWLWSFGSMRILFSLLCFYLLQTDAFELVLNLFLYFLLLALFTKLFFYLFHFYFFDLSFFNVLAINFKVFAHLSFISISLGFWSLFIWFLFLLAQSIPRTSDCFCHFETRISFLRLQIFDFILVKYEETWNRSFWLCLVLLAFLSPFFQHFDKLLLLFFNFD